MAHGDGTIKLISNPGEPTRYQINVSLGRDKTTGKYKRVKRIIQCSYEQAVQIRNEIKNPPAIDTVAEQPLLPISLPEDTQLDEGIVLHATAIEQSKSHVDYIPPSRFDTMAPVAKDSFAALASFHASRKKAFGKWAASTEHAYWHNMNRFILPYLGTLSVNTFTTRLIEEYYYQLMVDYQSKTGRSAAGIINEIHGYLKATLSSAIRLEMLEKNPCTYAERPKYERPEKGTLSIKEARRVLDILDEEGDIGYTIGVRLGLCAGLRPEESLGLAWSTVNLDEKTIRIVQAKTRFELKGPKTKSSKRTIVLDSNTADHLKQYHIVQAKQLRSYGIESNPATFVMTGRSGKPMGYETYKTWWRRFREHHNIRSSTGNLLTLHELRHTYCSLLLGSGAPITAVSKAIGHHDAHVTCSIYAHALPNGQTELASLFSAMTNRETGTQDEV